MTLPAEFVAPGENSVSRVVGAAAAACDIPGSPEWTQWARLLGFPSARRACVVLVDGLGESQLRERSGHFPFLRRSDVRSLTTVAPSTTAAAVTAVGTGASPGLTGMLGYTVRHPATGTLMNMIKWDHDVVRADEWQTVPSIAAQSSRPDRFSAVGPARFVGSGLNTAALRGFRDISAEDLSQRVDATVSELRSGRSDLVYLYWGEIDHVGHVHGWQSWQWGDEASATDRELDRLARLLPRDTLLVITADHGMVDVTESLDAHRIPQLRAGVDLVAGEPRASHLYTREPAEVSARWRDYLGERAWVVSRAEAAGIIGPLDPRFEAAIGDVVVFARGQTVIVDSSTQTPGSMALIGVHGSLTAPEMYVPCAVVVC